MTEHQCVHETDLAVMAKGIGDLCEDQREMKSDIKDIKTILVGNGNVGVRTQQELNKAAIKRLYWLFGGSFGGLSILILIVNFVR